MKNRIKHISLWGLICFKLGLKLDRDIRSDVLMRE
jgi:hypothetical protein